MINSQNLTKCLILGLALTGSVCAQTITFPTNGLQTVPSVTQRVTPLDKFDTAPVLAIQEIPGINPGRSQRVRLVQAKFKYPLIRIEESIDSSGRDIYRDKIMVADHVVLRLKKDTDATEFARRNGFNVRRKLLLPDVYLVAVPATLSGIPDAIEKLQSQPEVVFVHADFIAQSCKVPDNSPQFKSQWSLQNTGQSAGGLGLVDADIDATDAWDYFTGDGSVKVAVIDTGVEYANLDLAANMGTNASEIPNNGIDDDGNGLMDDSIGWDFVNDDADPMDDSNHGTAVAGIIGAVGNNGIGGEGVCWSVKMIPIKVLDEDGYAVGSSVSEGIWYAAGLGVDVINMSLINFSYEPATEFALSQAAINDIVVVCSAGNHGGNNDNIPNYPSDYNFGNIISVAATDNKDQLVANSTWASNYGASKVDLCAPGNICKATSLEQNGKMGNFSGTSAAAPHVAGAAALLKNANLALTAVQIKAAILESVDKIPPLAGKVATGGRLNVYKAIKTALAMNPTAEDDFYNSPSHKIMVNDGSGVFENDGFSNKVSIEPEITQQPLYGTLKPEMKNNLWTGRFEYVNTTGVQVPVDTFKYRVSIPEIGKQTNEATVELKTWVKHFKIRWEEWNPFHRINEVVSYVVPSYDKASVKIDVEFPESSKGGVKITRQPNQGLVTLSRDNQLEYVPNRGSKGVDKFQVTLSDSSETRTIEVTIQPESPGSLQER